MCCNYSCGPYRCIRYILPGDRVGFLEFDHLVRTRLELQTRIPGDGRIIGMDPCYLEIQGRQLQVQSQGGTAYKDAIVQSLKQWPNVNEKEPSGHTRWIVALTDGQDGGSVHGLGGTIEHLKTLRSPFYSLDWE